MTTDALFWWRQTTREIRLSGILFPPILRKKGLDYRGNLNIFQTFIFNSHCELFYKIVLSNSN